MENTLNKLFDFFKSQHMKIHFLGERLADFFSDIAARQVNSFSSTCGFFGKKMAVFE